MAVSDLTWGTTTAWGVFIAFTAAAVWSSIPLTMRLFATFKRYRGLYFYSILVTTWGLTIRAIAEMLHYLVPGVPWVLVQLMAQGGWMSMVTGFALTLYSRLNLILETRRWILWIIIFNATVIEPMMVTLSIGMAALSAKGDQAAKARWNTVFKPTERIAIMTLFTQETLISFIYIWAAYKYLKNRFGLDSPSRTKRAMMLLVSVQIAVLIVDVGIIVIDYLGYNTLKLFLNSFVYAFKLELEFIVLNQLVDMSQLGIPGIRSAAEAIREYQTGQDMERGVPEFVTVAKTNYSSAGDERTGNSSTAECPAIANTELSIPNPEQNQCNKIGS